MSPTAPDPGAAAFGIRSVHLVDVLELRQAILRPTQPVEACVFPGDEDPSAVHVAAFVDESMVGIATLAPDPRPAGDPEGRRIRMVGVTDGARGRGIGSALVATCLAHAPAGEVWLSARLHLVGWYESLGFVAVGRVYDKRPVGAHRDMVIARP